ncbi:thiamine pyrophosphate-dependent enzyme [Nocardiopsis mangrovi]|uniref:Thiamine pyrophosphate-dependent enzyme n=1 Tax=Nocardiopsis mangrovi TaxID=1179818 RepID=A0ABV9DS01_9ACTN
MTAAGGTGRTVRDATLDVLREFGLTTLFTNPGSTEIPFLTDLPDDIRPVLALHEGSVVGMATGWAIARGGPALVQLHTTAGLGNAVGALATARANRAPLVVLVGQQDRRHLATEPFLAGRLRGLAGDYPVGTDEPATAQDVPGAVARAHHAAVHGRGPALVIVPVDDWARPAADGAERAAASRVARGAAADPSGPAEIAALIDTAAAPALVTGAGTDTGDGWAALVALAERIGAPVHQESFGARAGFPQDHPLFAGILPADRPGLRAALAGHDAVVAVGAPVFRQYMFAEGPLVEPGTRLALLTDDPAEAHRSPVELAVLGPLPAALRAVTERVRAREPRPSAGEDRPGAQAAAAPPAGGGGPLPPAHVFAELARRARPDTVIVEETPSSRPDLHRHLPARRPLGFLSAAMGGLGFALPGAIGVRMARPDRPVIAVVGDGSCLYQVQALWSAAHYRAGVLVAVLSNGCYAVMDRLAERAGGKPSWPPFEEVSVAALARGLGCTARRVTTHAELTDALDAILPALHDRRDPVLLDIAVATDASFQP